MSTASRMRTVLLVDDEPGMRAALTAHFTREGWQVTAAANLREAEYRLAQHEFDLLVSDVRLPDGSGIALVEAAAPTPAVLLTAYATVPDAVEAMRSGASEYLTKPVAWPQLRAIAAQLLQTSVNRAIFNAGTPTRTVHEHNGALRDPAAASDDAQALGHALLGRCPALLTALSRARAAAGTDADILLEAETGTGKLSLARFIHEASDRTGQPFVVVDCDALPEHLLERELFGCARGAFDGAVNAKAGSFESAHRGTLVLRHVDKLPSRLQPQLLRVLQSRTVARLGTTVPSAVSLRVIATTDAALAEAVAQGSLRVDLFHRLSSLSLSLPPLRERAGDIPLLVNHFARAWAGRTGRPVPEFAPALLRELQSRPWRGNVRELGTVLHSFFTAHAEAGAPGPVQSMLLQQPRPAVADSTQANVPRTPEPPLPKALPIRELERLHLEKILLLTQGNRTHAAEILGISLRTMRNKIREYGLPPRRYA